jgi:hypothetical protein
MTMRRREDRACGPIDLDRRQIRVLCAFQRGEPKDTHHD